MATPRKGSKPSRSTSPSGEGSASSVDSSGILAVVRGLAEAVAEHGLSELVVDTPDATFTLRRGSLTTVASAPVHAVHAVMPVAAPPPIAPAASAPAAPSAGAPAADTGHVVTSPFVGTFYRRPSPDAAEYVRINDRVKKNQVLCIIEAMKLMNEIEADVDGTLVAILVQDGASVEYGQPLFKISPA